MPLPLNIQLVSLVIPVFNEQENVGRLHAELRGAIEGLEYACEIIYVDDGSSDASWPEIKKLQAAQPQLVRAIRLRRNFGQTAAMAAGFDAARGEVVITLDADLQNDPADIPRLIQTLRDGYDVVSGWRANRRDDFISRTLPSRLANALISRLTRVHLHDYGCTLKAYRSEVIREMHPYGEMHRFLPALASWTGARVAELKVNHRPRLYGASKYGIGRTLRVVLDLITVKFLLSYSTKPMQIFGRWGAYSALFGFLCAVITIVEKLGPHHTSLNRNGWFFLAIFFVLSGLQLICMGLLGEIGVRTYYESQGRTIYTIDEVAGEAVGIPTGPAK